MGTDIHVVAQKWNGEAWETLDIEPFRMRNYGVFGFLANVRNISNVPSLLDEPTGLPSGFKWDDEDDCWDYHSLSWLPMSRLLGFDYDSAFEDARVRNDSYSAPPGEGMQVTFRKFLGQAFFEDLAKLRAAGCDRIMFGFDC